LLEAGWQVLTIDLRATGETAVAHDSIGDAPDHNSVEWSIWMGRPLLGQWCWDAIRAADWLASRQDVDIHSLALVGIGAGGLAAICAAALDERFRSVAAIDTLASFVTALPFQGHRVVTMVPFLLDVGDVPHLTALAAPRRLVVANPLDAQSKPLEA